jgi:hypothetical protein
LLVAERFRGASGQDEAAADAADGHAAIARHRALADAALARAVAAAAADASRRVDTLDAAVARASAQAAAAVQAGWRKRAWAAQCTRELEALQGQRLALAAAASAAKDACRLKRRPPTVPFPTAHGPPGSDAAAARLLADSLEDAGTRGALEGDVPADAAADGLFLGADGPAAWEAAAEGDRRASVWRARCAAGAGLRVARLEADRAECATALAAVVDDVEAEVKDAMLVPISIKRYF